MLNPKGGDYLTREIMRQIWFINGVLDQSFLNPLLLQQVYTKYRSLDLVPSHYYYPELLQKDEDASVKMTLPDIEALIA